MKQTSSLYGEEESALSLNTVYKLYCPLRYKQLYELYILLFSAKRVTVNYRAGLQCVYNIEYNKNRLFDYLYRWVNKKQIHNNVHPRH